MTDNGSRLFAGRVALVTGAEQDRARPGMLGGHLMAQDVRATGRAILPLSIRLWQRPK